jgi:hypothetical protein
VITVSLICVSFSIARKLAAKASLATRIDALSEDALAADGTMGAESRAYLEAQIRNEQERGPRRISGGKPARHEQYHFKRWGSDSMLMVARYTWDYETSPGLSHRNVLVAARRWNTTRARTRQ